VKPEDVLERCWQEIAAGRGTPAACQARFPDVAGLEAQLHLAQQLRTMAALTLRPHVLYRQEMNLRRYVRAHYQPVAPQRRWRWSWRFALALGALALVVLSVGLTQAAGSSLPGEPLYGVKRTTETVALIFTPPTQRAAQYLRQAQQRLAEIEQLSRQGTADPALMATLLTDLAAATEAAVAAVDNVSPDSQVAVLTSIVLETDRQESVLAALETVLPDEAKPALALARTAASQSHTQASMQLARPSPTPGASATMFAEASATFIATPTPFSPKPTHVQPTVGHKPPTFTPESPRPTTIPPTPTQRVLPSPIPTTHTPPQPTNPSGGGQPDCTGNNPNAPNYCTPTPLPPEPTPMPTPCPTNPGGQPVCH
jgi:hypothetical protein